LHKAAQDGKLTVAKFLLENGADVNALTGQQHRTPLLLAAETGNRAMVELLISKAADINAKDYNNQSALHISSEQGFKAVVQTLLENKADVNAKTYQGQTPLHVAISKGNKAVAELLLANGANVNAKNAEGQTPLFRAISLKNLEMTKFLIANKADVNAIAMDGRTPLYEAVSTDQSIVELLLQNGAKIEAKFDYKDYKGWTPLHQAVALGRKEIVETLLQGGANPNSTNNLGVTPLHHAASGGQLEIAELLVAHKADVNAKATDGDTPLLWAVKTLKKPLIEFLLTKKADPNLANSSNKTPLSIVNEKMTSPSFPGQFSPVDLVALKEIRELLIKNGADENQERRAQISVTRDGKPRYPIFNKGTNSWNRFSLLETFGAAYIANSQINGFPAFPTSAFPFPSLTKVKIHRLEANGEREIPIDLEAILKSGDCAKDMWLEWGDVIEFPEADHKINESWKGFPKELLEIFPKCLARQVSISVKDEPNSIALAPILQPAAYKPEGETAKFAATDFNPWLNNVVSNSGLLRTSSDKTRVKVKRVNPATKQTQEMIFNLEKNEPQNNLWLRDGDVIE
ncbi:MAG: ankyrin repeat domain-containing protein, partial [Limisphaerales bacterium]